MWKKALIAILILGAPVAAGAATLGEKDAQALMGRAVGLRDALSASDYDGVVARLHPNFVAVMGGKEALSEANRVTWEDLKSKGFRLDAFDFTKPTEAWDGTTDRVTFVLNRMVLISTDHVVTTDGYLVGSRKKDGGKWYFIDGGSIKSIEALRVLFPGLPDGVELPPITSDTKSNTPSVAASASGESGEPEFVGVPDRVVRSGDSLQRYPLERQTYTMRTKAKMWKFRGGAKMTYDIPGGRSPVRFGAGQALEFIVRTASRSIDPSSQFRLVPLTVGQPGRKARKSGLTAVRQVLALEADASYGGSVTDMSMGGQVLLTKPYGTASFIMIAGAPLSPGEYALLNTASSTAFCFGVD